MPDLSPADAPLFEALKAWRLRAAGLAGCALPSPPPRWRAGEEALAAPLEAGRQGLDSRADRIGDGPTGLPADFERLRWFHLPPSCLAR